MSNETLLDADYRLEDRYERESGRVHLNGDQALVRLLLEQRRRDRRGGLGTAGFVSGYRGSPLGGFDMELTRAARWLAAEDVHFEPGVNEDLAATAIWGTQQVPITPGSTRDGVFALWYGKGPGVDRSGDALKHGNFAGTSLHGGVLVVAGDDPAAKSSSLPHQSEPGLVAAGLPVVYPATHQDVLTLGLHGWAMSRATGCWVGLKVVTDLMDSSSTVQIPPADLLAGAATQLGPEDHIGWSKPALVAEQSLFERRLPAAQQYWRAYRLDRSHGPADARIGIVAAGRTYLETREALERLGLDDVALNALGVRVYQPTMTWPLERQSALEFARGLDDLLVVEEKQPLIEQQLTRHLYGESTRPRLYGKVDVDGRPLVPSTGELTADDLRPLLARFLAGVAREWTAPPPPAPRELVLLAAPRQATFCAGCPHNVSTTVPEGSLALGGIGCHGMAVGMPNRNTLALTHMGGEGATWIGMSRYTETDHVFQNLGDGTFYHSGLMAVRAAVAAGVNITYKILANGAIAMTGGQQIEGEPQDGRELVPDIVRQLVAQGVGRIVVVNDGSHTYRKGSLPADVPVLHRDRLDEVQAELRQVPGVTAIVYDQFCAAEARRLRKRGKLPVPAERVVINERVCEGCGDCNHVSNCIAVEPVETPFGRKRHVNQSACNLDLSCVKGYCPSFVTVHGGVLTTADDVTGVGLEEAFGSLPAPPSLTGEVVDVLITGVGGTGISTTGAVLGMAAHLDGRSASVLNQTGLAQKNGPVSSHVRIRPSGHATFARRIGRSSADVVLAADLLTTVDPKLLDLFSRERTRSVVDVAVAPTARLTVDPDVDLTPQPLVEVVRARSHETVALRFKRIATELLGPTAEANVVLLGYALQRGMLGVSAEGLERAIELNGVAVELNKRAVGLGRLLAADPAAVDRLLGHQAPAPTDEPQDALAIAEQRARVLTSYQGARYAARYRRLVDAALRREAEIEGTGEFARAVATSFHKLMAYKDEYEVARLYTDGVFRDQLGAEFSSFQGLSLNLAPQRFFPTDPRTGRPRKIAIPGRAGFLALGALARMKVLRGGPLDVFGRTEHRRRERALIREYEQLITGLLRDIGPATYELAVQLAAIPEHIRGYGDIKDASIDEAMVLQAELLAKFRELAQWESGTMTPSREEQ